MMVPRRLQIGDCVGVVAPASPFDIEAFNQGLACIQAMGLQPQIPEGLYDRKGYLAGTDRDRAEMVNALFQDKSIQGIICARGGFGSMKALPFLDHDLIRRNPKVFIGYSDISALLVFLVQNCGLVCFHGPMVTSLAGDYDRNARSLFAAITSREPIQLIAEKALVLRAGRVTTHVVGGNLTTLCHLVGTPYAPVFADKILVLEDRGEAPYRIDRMLTQMKYSGSFRDLAGLALGTFTDCGSLEEIYCIVKDLFTEEDFPILAGLDIGHSDINLTIPLGLEATLDTNPGSLWFSRSATRT